MGQHLKQIGTIFQFRSSQIYHKEILSAALKGSNIEETHPESELRPRLEEMMCVRIISHPTLCMTGHLHQDPLGNVSQTQILGPHLRPDTNMWAQS